MWMPPVSTVCAPSCGSWTRRERVIPRTASRRGQRHHSEPSGRSASLGARNPGQYHIDPGVIVARDRNEAINSYITDMLALEDHIEKAVKGQLTDLKEYPEVVAALRDIHHQGRASHLRPAGAERPAKRRWGGRAVKRAGSAVAGVAAGVIDLVRTEGLPKNLRDDYTAFSLANIGYLMLHTTALAFEDQEVADLARSTSATTPTWSCGSTISSRRPSRDSLSSRVCRCARTSPRK